LHLHQNTFHANSPSSAADTVQTYANRVLKLNKTLNIGLQV